MSLRCVVRAALVFVAATSSLACNQILGIHQLRDEDASTPVVHDDAKTVVTSPDAGQNTRVDGGGASSGDASVGDAGSMPAPCNPSDLRCSPMGQVIQQCDLTGTWRDTSVCTYACTGSGATTACTGVCMPGDRSCGDSNTPLLCNAMGQNQAQPECTNLCADGMCSGDCKPNTTRCVSGSPNMFQTCDATGQWGAADACTFVCDAATGTCAGECTPGAANRCSGNAVQSCDATGHWVTTTTCTSVPCSAGQCRACMANEKQCNAGKPQTCSAAGAWTDDQATACPFVCDAATGKCAGECMPGTDLCTAQVTKHCGTNGTYGAGTTCTNICDTTTGRCGGVCAPGAHRCNGAASQTCGTNGQWGTDTSCPFGCSATSGQCNACTDEAMSVTCGGGKCGPIMNNCGHTVMCSTTCAGTGESCGGGGVNGVCGCRPEAATQTCGTHCGTMANNCGQQVTCTTTCTSPQTCGGGGTPNVCGCTPKTATAACTGKNCGSVSDGCTGTVTCGACTSPQTCGGGGAANVCGCTPMAAAAACGTRTCGTAPNGCGGTVNCGTMSGGCPSGMVCNSNGTCASTCTPLTACPSGKNCGTIDNGCGTGTLTCGTMSGGCPSGQTCGGGSPGVANVCGCTPVSMTSVCASAGKNCGTVSNGCAGGTYNCGTCSAPQTCGGGGTANMCGCTPLTVTQACTNAGKNCGSVDNACGGTVACGSCSAPNTCGGSGTANLCGCTPSTPALACGTRNCGTVPNGCNGTLTCGLLAAGACPTGQACSASGMCTCVPKSPSVACGTHDCGTASDGCTGTVNCGQLAGACPSGEACTNGMCTCVPLTVAQACTAAKKNCGTVPDGCNTGGTVNCGTCTSPQTCGGGNPSVPNVCGCNESDPAFCSRLGKTCGTVTGTDLCRVSRSVNCGTCTSGCCGSTNTCVSPETPAACAPTGQTCQICPATANQTATCSSAGVCGFTCKPGFLGAQCQTPMFQPIAFSLGAPGIFAVRVGDLSADGLAVLGYADFDGGSLNHPFRFTQAGGIEDLTSRSGLLHFFTGVNASGSIGAGSNDSGIFRWTLSTTPTPLTPPTSGTGCGSTGASPRMSRDSTGSVIISTCDFPDDLFGTVTKAVRWSGSSPDMLTVPPGIIQSWASDVNGDGSAIAGYYILDNVFHPVRWRSLGLTTTFDELGSDPAFGAAPSAISEDGQVVAGSGFDSATSATLPFRWTSAGIVKLGLPAGRPNGFPTDANRDGSVIVGWTGGGSEATVWDSAGVHLLRDMLIAAGLPSTQLSGWSLGVAAAVSDDGNVIAGYGINPSGQSEPWVARLR